MEGLQQEIGRISATLVRHRRVTIAGTEIFYREAGLPGAPTLLALHGFPSSSRQFRHLLPALAESRHVIAPDLPGFGFSACPDRGRYSYSFNGYAETIDAFARALGLTQYALYLHDYGAQTGFRLAMQAPQRVRALVIQNSEAYYADGRSPGWAAMEAYWRDPSARRREALRRGLFTEEGIRREFLEQLPPAVAELIDPDTILLAWTQVSRPGVVEALLDLHLDYRTNVDLYPAVQAYFRERRPPSLILWGREDQYYGPAAAAAYRRDLPAAEIQIIDGGHWVLESHGPQVIELTRRFLDRQWPASRSRFDL
jgi:pimeloyl-ACP methyl ester carboxylesterase